MGRTREFDEATVVAAAGEVFGWYGFEGTSIDDLVARLGVHRGSLYRTFGSKLGIYHLALRRRMEQQIVPWIDGLGDDGEDVLAASVRRPAAAQEGSGDDGDAWTLLLRAAVESAPGDEQAEEQVDRVCGALELRLAERYGRELAPALVATVLGLHLMARAGVAADPEASARTLGAALRVPETTGSTPIE
jgi:TetR/AcrR family transcriptional regulator, transcriptional repressor for nem operon